MNFARHSQGLYAAFYACVRPYLKHRISRLWLRDLKSLQETLSPDEPVIFVANHISWFDGFLIKRLQETLRPEAQLYIPVLEREVRAHPYLQRFGVVPIDGASPKSVIRAFAALEERRKTLGSRFALLYFPQGRIVPSWAQPLGFRSGVSDLLARLAPAQVAPVGLHIEPLTAPAPHAFVSCGPPLRVREAISREALEQEVARALALIFSELQRTEEAFPALKSAEWQELKW